MKYTLGDLLPILARFADRGMCPNDTGGYLGSNRVVQRINESVKRLSKKPGTRDLTQCVRMCVHNGCVTLGRDIRKLYKARMDGCIAHVFDKWYEYLETGPGLVDGSNYILQEDLVDRGLTCTQYDMPAPMRVMVFSDHPEDSGATILIRGFDETNREVIVEVPTNRYQFGEYVPITMDQGYYTQSQFSQISSVQKPVTNGYVFLSAVTADDWDDPGTLTREHLAVYHPDETRPSYRRYAFPTSAYSEGVDMTYRLNALVKMQIVPMTRSTDVCLIENIAAIKMMMQAIGYYDAGDANKGFEFEQLAEKLILEDADDYETVEVIPDIQMHGWGMDDIEHV